MRFHWFMHSEPPAPSRDPRDAWRLIRQWLWRCPELRSQAMTRMRDEIHRFAQTVWILAAFVCLFSVVVGELGQPGGAKHLLDLSFVPAVFLAFRYVLLAGSSDDSLRIRRLMKNAPELGGFVAVVVGAFELHLVSQGRVLGNVFLLLAAARFAPKLRGISGRAPEPITERVRWYLALWGFGMLAITMFAQAWALTTPQAWSLIRFQGEPSHPPVHGVLIVGVWFPAVLAVVLIGWPVAKRLMTGGLTPIGADGRRRFFVRHLLVSLVLSGLTGALALKPLGQPMLSWTLGLIVGLVVSGVWEALVRSNALLRGPGPLIWGFGLFLIFAGVHEAITAPGQTHTGPAEWAAAITLSMGVWVEWYVVREVLGLRGPGKSAQGDPSVS
jgi:hypothetical protein